MTRSRTDLLAILKITTRDGRSPGAPQSDWIRSRIGATDSAFDGAEVSLDQEATSTGDRTQHAERSTVVIMDDPQPRTTASRVLISHRWRIPFLQHQREAAAGGYSFPLDIETPGGGLLQLTASLNLDKLLLKWTCTPELPKARLLVTFLSDSTNSGPIGMGLLTTGSAEIDRKAYGLENLNWDVQITAEE